jgi:structure-specific recognition protein 1
VLYWQYAKIDRDRLILIFSRGRFDIELFGSFLEMHGKEKEYKVNYSSIVKLFQLPRPDKGKNQDKNERR